MATTSSIWKPENDLLFCDGTNLVMNVHGQLMTGKGFITSYDYSMGVEPIGIPIGMTNSYGGYESFSMHNSHVDLSIGIRLYRDDTVIGPDVNLPELLTKKLSEFDLIKEVNRRFKKEQ